MKNITIISKENCTECEKIKSLMSAKGLEYTEKKMEGLPMPTQFELRNIARKNRQRSMPLLFIEDAFVTTSDFIQDYLA